MEDHCQRRRFIVLKTLEEAASENKGAQGGEAREKKKRLVHSGGGQIEEGTTALVEPFAFSPIRNSFCFVGG